MGRPSGDFISIEDLENLTRPYSRPEWGQVLGLAVTTIDKWFHRGRIQPKHRVALEVAHSMLASEPGSILRHFMPGGPLRGLFEVHLSGALHKKGLAAVEEGGFIDPRKAVRALKEPLGDGRIIQSLSDQDLVAELERRGWVVTLALNKNV